MMKALKKSLLWIMMTLSLSLIGGCMGAEIVIGSLSGISSYYSYKASKVTLYSADCAAEMIMPDFGYIERWTDSEQRQLLAHVRFYQDECGK